jgi:Rad3-related DNA helicase
MEFFPLPAAREKQQKAIEFIFRAISKGYRDIVIAAPTGCGKSAIAITVSRWSQNTSFGSSSAPGGYVLTTQKMLQDQYDEDFEIVASLKSSTEYECLKMRNCGTGSRLGCGCQKTQFCPYSSAKENFLRSEVALTNYPYFFSEKTYVHQFPRRRVLVCDECHTLCSQILKFIDCRINKQILNRWADGMPLPNPSRLQTIEAFVEFLVRDYLPKVKQVFERKKKLFSDKSDDDMAMELVDIDQHICKTNRAIELIMKDKKNWVYWNDAENEEFSAKPLDAAPFFGELVESAADVRIYMSAYPGEKMSFCRSLGLDPDKVAWASFSSQFPVENRPIVFFPVGSMGRKMYESTLPDVVTMVKKIASRHANEKGLIHCSSYKIGEAISSALLMSQHANRVIFPEKSEERMTAFKRHAETETPTILISPSMTEGFDFAGDLASWQIIAKCPYPSLGDPQISIKKERDPEWYAIETLKTIIQATGRIVRNETDKGTTYILDADFGRLLDKYSYAIPKWWSQALIVKR